MSDVRIEPQVVCIHAEFQVGHLIRDLSQDLAPNPKATASCDQGEDQKATRVRPEYVQVDQKPLQVDQNTFTPWIGARARVACSKPSASMETQTGHGVVHIFVLGFSESL